MVSSTQPIPKGGFEICIRIPPPVGAPSDGRKPLLILIGLFDNV